jgi:glycosyltransferase involved in cell wall biosynthesis
VADQALQPDRVIVQDNCSTDNTEEVVKAYKRLKIEWVQNGRDTLSIGNFNQPVSCLSPSGSGSVIVPARPDKTFADRCEHQCCHHTIFELAM